MKILFVSGELIGSALCQKLVKEGNEVKLYIQDDDWEECLDGIVTKTENWRGELNWVGKDGLIVVDDVLFGEEQDWLRHFGYKVVGSSMKADLLELDRRHFQEIAKEHGIETLPSYNFSTAQDAINFVEENKAQWVLKQSSHMSSLNYVGQSKTGVDVLEMLQTYKKENISPVHIQQYASGIEVGVARYFNGVDWVGPVEINHEHKRLNEGDTGPLTPEMGTVLWYSDTEIPLFKETLGKLKPYLQKIRFKGDIDINCIVNKSKIWPIEATPRFGKPSTEIQIALHNSKWTDFLYALAEGTDYSLDYKTDFGIAVSIAVEPFPYEPSKLSKIKNSQERSEISFADDISEEDLENIHLEEVAKDKLGYKWTGTHGLILHVTAHGKTIEEAQKKVYERVGKIKIPKMFYRKDIGNRVSTQDIPKLKEWGWI